MKLNKCFFILSSIFILAGCSGQQDDVVARIGDIEITASEFQDHLTVLMKPQQINELSTVARSNILKSLLLGRVMQQRSYAKMSEQERNDLDKKVRAYRDKMLVNYYLQKKTNIDPVSEKMAHDYYLNNLEKYGKSINKKYMLVTTQSRVTEKQRSEIIARYHKLKDTDDIEKVYMDLKSSSAQFSLSKHDLDKKTSITAVDKIVMNLSQDSISSLNWIKGRPVIVKVISENVQEAAPFSDVKTEIRKALAPIQVKAAIKDESEKIFKTLKVEYFGEFRGLNK